MRNFPDLYLYKMIVLLFIRLGACGRISVSCSFWGGYRNPWRLLATRLLGGCHSGSACRRSERGSRVRWSAAHADAGSLAGYPNLCRVEWHRRRSHRVSRSLALSLARSFQSCRTRGMDYCSTPPSSQPPTSGESLIAFILPAFENLIAARGTLLTKSSFMLSRHEYNSNWEWERAMLFPRWWFLHFALFPWLLYSVISPATGKINQIKHCIGCVKLNFTSLRKYGILVSRKLF